ncbi:histidine phosphatase family protein [Bacillus sp. ISL-51]|uniref:histidine phosphatase family protein n=1 Tax=Bacteria TaxID=2 RepID=UPI001BE7F432|nr:MULTISPECIES: histidine phosphatase family protein [Bacteria]MBT2573918.1 histidine phosphatase family protein [Bacillus sp. ISL-51]MBT2634751.1 histidine phosphatase family protein [Bacillus sp. ISL-26]MBT2712226.1 histidine phosphatase family protein [Pseudomonas sp. ISL-88]
MTAVCLVRHGETDWNAQKKLQGKTDIPLNATGERQAKETGEYLKDFSWDVIVSSPMKRARKTADIINSFLNLPIVEMEDFKERSYGDAEGMSLPERSKRYPDKNYPNMETDEELTDRMLAGLVKVQRQFPEKKVLIVAHGAAIHALLSAISGGDIDIQNAKLVNACLSNIQWIENKWHVKDYNVSSHLSAQ